MKGIKQEIKRSYDRVKSVYEGIKSYNTSLYKGRQYRETWKEVEKYIMFVGYPRSGHSLVGALLDAHPNVIIAHELDALELVNAGYSKNQIYYLLLNNSQEYAARGREWEGYSYYVPHQWQGRFNKLKIIGDKKGGASTRRLGKTPSILTRLEQKIDVPVKYIHVVRNPYDNITTIDKRHNISMKQGFQDSIDYYFYHCQQVDKIKKNKADDIFEIRHEKLIEDPKTNLQQLCSFLEIEGSQDYLEDCASIVFKSPRKSRCEGPWTEELIDSVQQKMEEYSFLNGYAYEE